ncbi:MAG TPA: glycoside hydrolase family 88 protein [Gammaproteobacteria bacterium]
MRPVQLAVSSLLLVFLGHACVAQEGITGQPPAGIAKLAINELLSRKHYMMYETYHFTGIHYAEAAMGYGALKFAKATHNSGLLKALSRRYRDVPGTGDLLSADHVDANVYGILPLELYLVDQDERKLKEGLALADAQWLKPRKDGLTRQTRYWIDDVWMINSLQVQAYRATADSKYLDRAAVQTEAYLRQLQQANGLFYHGKDAPFYWGRGNGWVAAGLAELLSELPRDHPRYEMIASGYKRMMKALLTYQADDGMWRQLIDKPESWKETSSTAMFGFSMATGVKQGILLDKKYSNAYKKAWAALVTYVDKDGKLHEVCVGTGQSRDIDYYLQRPRTAGDFHGQAPLLWFARIMLNEHGESSNNLMKVH